MTKINASNKFLQYLSNNEECNLFYNNKEYFIFYPNKKKLFKLNYINNNENKFILNEYEFNSDFKTILENLKKLKINEKNIGKMMNSPLNKLSESINFYLINNNWIKFYKKFYNYDLIIKKKNEDDKTLLSLFKKEILPKELKSANNLIPDTQKINNITVPINFEIINKDLFDSILEDINKNNKINLKINSNYSNYKISFGDNKIFVKDNSNFYYIYTYMNNNYELEYIILMKNIDLIFYLKHNKNIDYNSNLTLEDFLLEYGINLSKTDYQRLIDINLDIFGEIINMNPKKETKLKEVNHCLGLENIGATCYMNATIQCLCHVLNMKKYFQDRQTVYNDTKNKNCPLTKEFFILLNNLWKKPSNGKNYFTPKNFKNKISEMNPLFKGIAANDSKDLIIFLYETIHNEINNPNNYYQNNTFNQNNIFNQDNDLILFRQNYYSVNSSFLIKTFYFEQQNTLLCLNCGFNKISYNITNIIIFPLEKVREYMVKKSPTGFLSVTLDNCFENYQDEELLVGANQIFCNNCRCMSNAKTGNKMFTSPEVMTIILNRGKGLEFDVNFEYPLTVNINKYVTDKTTNNNYELICVLTHLGPSGMAGHFIAFCKSPINDQWYCYNDAMVSKVNDPRYQNNNQIEGIPYVLFYQRSNKNQNKKNNNNYSNNLITLIFKYNGNEYPLDIDIDKNTYIYEIIKRLNKL